MVLDHALIQSIAPLTALRDTPLDHGPIREQQRERFNRSLPTMRVKALRGGS